VLQLLHGLATLTMTEALSDLLAEETHLHSMAGSHVPAPHSMLAASHKRGGSRGSSLEPCKHCNKNTHRSEQCFEKYPEKLVEYRSRRAAQGRGNPKGFVSVVAASSVAAPKPSWVLDLGASFHVTSDRSQLGTCMPITDGASVQTVDGTSCPVTYKGSLCNSQFSVSDISLVPQLSMDLLSVGQITEQNCFVGFDSSSCFIQDRQSGTVIGTGHRRRDSSRLCSGLTTSSIFHLPTSPMCPPLHTLSFAQWH
jgi:hypothetical protein